MKTQTSDRFEVDNSTQNKTKLRRKIEKTISLGILTIVIAAIAIIQPLFTQIGANLLFEEIFFAAGIVRFLYAFNTRSSGKFKLKLALALVYILAGLLILINQNETGQIINYILGITIVINGALEIILALQVRRVAHQWGWILLSGIVAIALGIALAAKTYAVWVMGILVGLNLLVSGLWITLVAFATRSALQKVSA